MKPFTAVAVVFFTLIGLAHLLRLVLGWSVIVNGLVVPMWVSVIALLVTAMLSFMLWRENRR
jgi:hypothetical protein